MSERKPIDWRSMSDEDYLQRAEQQIWLSAFANNNPRAPAHVEADRAYDEAKRREKPWLYQRAWNAAYLSCGYQPSEMDIAEFSASLNKYIVTFKSPRGDDWRSAGKELRARSSGDAR